MRCEGTGSWSERVGHYSIDFFYLLVLGLNARHVVLKKIYLCSALDHHQHFQDHRSMTPTVALRTAAALAHYCLVSRAQDGTGSRRSRISGPGTLHDAQHRAYYRYLKKIFAAELWTTINIFKIIAH